MKLLLFLQPMSSLPLWGTGTAHPQDEKVRVGQQTTARQVWNFVGLSYKLWFGRKSIDCSPLPQGESRSVACKPVLQ